MSGIKYAGEVELQKLVLISSSGTAIDLTELVININIYESVFSHAMSGSIMIADTNKTSFEIMNNLSIFLIYNPIKNMNVL